MIYAIYKRVDGTFYFEGKGNITYVKRILLCLGEQGFTDEDIKIITIQKEEN